jgi:hypothetical protein
MTLALCRSCRANDRNHWDINVIGALVVPESTPYRHAIFSITLPIGPAKRFAALTASSVTQGA